MPLTDIHVMRRPQAFNDPSSLIDFSDPLYDVTSDDEDSDYDHCNIYPSLSPLPPRINSPSVSSSVERNFSHQKILQWNVNGLHSTLPMLQQDLFQRNIQIALLQECYRKYDHLYVSIPITYYHDYADDYGKTAIYVHESIEHKLILLSPNTNTSPVNRIHATAILAYLNVAGTRTPVVILNQYRSPSGTAQPLYYLVYLYYF